VTRISFESRAAGYVLLGLLALLWGASYPLLKIAVETIPPLTTAACRAILASVVLLALLGGDARRLAGPGLPRVRLALQAFWISILPWCLLTWASTLIPSGTVAILSSTSPIWVFLITWGFTRHEPATGRKLAGVILGIGGVVTIIGVDALGGPGRHTIAQSACVVAAMAYAMAAVWGRHFGDLPPLVTAAASTLIAAAVLVPVALILERPLASSPSARSMLALAVLGVFCTAGALACYYRILALLGSIATASQSYLRIGISVLLATVLLGERLTASIGVGLVLVLAGVIAMTLPARMRIREPR
jgi:drug/metabolite transporter (DMT)-like permease